MSRPYGPPPPSNSSGEDEVDLSLQEWERAEAERTQQQTVELHQLLNEVVKIMSTKADDADYLLPGLLTRHIELLLSMQGFRGVEIFKQAIQDSLEKKQVRAEFDEEAVDEAVEYIITFVDEFVTQAKALENTSSALLGRIIRAMKAARGDEDDMAPDLLEENQDEIKEIRRPIRKGRKEEILNDLLKAERDNLTPGFLRHIDAECRRISSAREVTPDTGKLLEILRVIQARVLEEIGREQLGEGALVLGQLLGYDDKSERLAVLDAGLMVQGMGFARELEQLTEDALAGFEELASSGSSPSIPSPEPELVRRVQEIHDRVKSHISKLEDARRKLETQWTDKTKEVNDDGNKKKRKDVDSQERNPAFQ